MCGIGVDIEDVQRFRARPFQTNKTFYKKIFTEQEISYCLKHKDPYPHFTARFCAKEATVKALGRVIDYTYIEIENNVHTGAPKLCIRKNEKMSNLISISHTRKEAIAFVLITNYDQKVPSS